jgi:3-deoxy-D-manno-octulosonate 8-phosphate phosphatase (KDO 8-P phosphatase)
MEQSYKELLHAITTFIFDVDGVLTDGRMLISESGELLRSMNARDGYAMKAALDQGYNICIITGGNNHGVRERLEGLGIQDIYLNAGDKTGYMRDYMLKNNVTAREVLYMGDDIPDIAVMNMAGLACCPQDAVNEVKNISHYISHRNGGDSCVRDIIEQVLKVHGKWYTATSNTISST